MNLDSLSFTLSQISYLVASLTKRKYKQVAEELGEVSVSLAIATCGTTAMAAILVFVSVRAMRPVNA